MTQILKFYALTVLLFITFHCTSNPFSDNEETKSNTQIVSGKIKLDDGSSADSVYVWLEEFDIGLYTNIKGEFKLSLPAPQEQPGGGVTGIFKIYFYVMNYKMEFIEVSLKNGLFVYNNGLINNNGELKDIIILQKLMNIKTEVIPQKIPADFNGFITVKLTLNSIVNPTNISAIIDDNNVISGIFIRNKIHKNEFLKQYFMTNSHIKSVNIPVIPTTSISFYKYETCTFPKGEYEVIPFIWVNQNNVPHGLLNNFTEFPGYMTPEYLFVPFKRQIPVVNIEHCDHRIGDDP